MSVFHVYYMYILSKQGRELNNKFSSWWSPFIIIINGIPKRPTRIGSSLYKHYANKELDTPYLRSK